MAVQASTLDCQSSAVFSHAAALASSWFAVARSAAVTSPAISEAIVAGE